MPNRFGARVPGDASALTSHLDGGAVITWNFSNFASARLDLEGLVALTRPEFVIAAAGTIYRRPPAGLRTSAGVELHF